MQQIIPPLPPCNVAVVLSVVFSVEACDGVQWLCVNMWGIYSVKPTWRHGTASALTSLISIWLRGEGHLHRAESVLQNCVMGRCAICIFMYCYKPNCLTGIALLVNSCWRGLNHPHHCLADWEREPLSAQHTSLSSQRIKCSNGRPYPPGLPTHPWSDFFMIGLHKECLPTCCEDRQPPSNKVPLE